MMGSTLELLLLFLVVIAQAAPPSITSTKNNFNWEKIKHIVAFGDSYTFVQGTRGHPKYSFIGNYDNNFSFTGDELLSNQIVQNFTGTSAGGPNWIEYISKCGLQSGLTLPSACRVQLWDFAFAGADISEKFTPLHHSYTVPMVNQTQQYLTWAEPVLKTQMDKSKALVAIWIGINDISDSKLYDVNLPELYDSMIEFMFESSVKPLYKAGYHNYLFINLPPIHRSPSYVNKAQPSLNATMIEWWNSRLSKYSSQFFRDHKSATTLVYDSFSFLNNVLDNPSNYEITNTSSFCPGYNNETVLKDPGVFGCTPLDSYFWYNSGHLSSHVHKLMAKDLVGYLKAESK
ncbi:putative lysophospholipase A [Dactylonectria estremocensis]|uniref:Lysophospholipase A n=1 Tax=Dactylonectria estremocensis TaxID=1079267 RepID=A0A9P9EUF5_9HYPO|nr:putative lysophospholipase A [Dactylonectria estremocensis]